MKLTLRNIILFNKNMPNINSVSFNLQDCTLLEESTEHRMWSNGNNIYHQLKVMPNPNWAFDLRDFSAASSFFSKQAIELKGAMLSLELIQVGYHTGLKGMFKYRSPMPDTRAMMFTNILWIPFQNWIIQINIEAIETGATGLREATAMVLEGNNWSMPKSASEQPTPVHTKDYSGEIHDTPLVKLPSDLEKYDAMFPDHPLSKIRRRMAIVIPSLNITALPNELLPYRRQ